MRYSRTVAAAAAAIAATSTVNATPLRRQADTISPCANVTAQIQNLVAQNVSQIFVDAQMAQDCLKSMPFDSALGSEFVVAVSKYLNFQSTIPILKDPPSTYLSPAVDLLAGIDAIYQKANTSQYQSQYDMDTDLQSLFSSANDGHLSAQFCSLGVFQFSTDTELVSISPDGLQVPKVYTFGDGRRLHNGETDISDVAQINGEDVVDYVTKLGLTQPNQDPDAQWNDVFPDPAKVVSGAGGQGAFVFNNGLWPGTTNIVLTFTNGSTYNVGVNAAPNVRFNYTSGDEVYQAVCVPAASSTSSGEATSTTAAPASTETSASPEPTESSVTAEPTETPAASSTVASSSFEATATAAPIQYPEPVVRDQYNLILGYYLDNEANDTAVLFIPSFSAGEGNQLPDEEAYFADVATVFVNESLAAGKTKMIIDVSGNPGGVILAGFDLFKLFFPDMEAYSATRMRDHPLEQLMLKGGQDVSFADGPNAFDGFYQSPFDWQSQVTPDQERGFTSWEDLYGPDVINGVNMTSVFANFNFTTQSTASSPIRGYGSVAINETSRPFAAENILIVGDGFCQSTCTTFTNLMTNFGGVRSLAFGGRPQDGPMQIMGGVRGAQATGWEYIGAEILGAYEAAVASSNTSSPTLTADELAMFVELAPPRQFPLTIGPTNLNLRNSYNPDDLDTPLQFSYQAASCRLFYTFENLVNPASQWLSAYNAIWGDSGCVSGSTNVTGPPASSNSTSGSGWSSWGKW